MPIRFPEILSLSRDGVRVSWNQRDAILYALAIGLGQDPMDELELPFVQHAGQRTAPTFATLLAPKNGVGPLGIDMKRTMAGGQAIRFHAPMPTAGEAVTDSRIAAVVDKGPRGAVIYLETTLRELETAVLIATMTTSIFATADGGFGGAPEDPFAPHRPPDRAPDLEIDLPTRSDQALLFRLAWWDEGRAHADPQIARQAGLPRPSLQGQCTFGLSYRAILQAVANYDPALVESHEARFSSVVIPGDVITFLIWRDGDVVSFEGHVKARGARVLSAGKAVLKS